MAKLTCSIVWPDQKVEELEQLKDELEEVLAVGYPGLSYSIDIISVQGNVLESTSTQITDFIDAEIVEEPKQETTVILLPR